MSAPKKYLICHYKVSSERKTKPKGKEFMAIVCQEKRGKNIQLLFQIRIYNVRKRIFFLSCMSKYKHLYKHLACVKVEMKLSEDTDLLREVLGHLSEMVIMKTVIQPYRAIKMLHNHFMKYPG